MLKKQCPQHSTICIEIDDGENRYKEYKIDNWKTR